MAGEMSSAIKRIVALGEWVTIAESFSSATFPPPMMSTRRLSSFTNIGKSMLASPFLLIVWLSVLDFIHPLTCMARRVGDNHRCAAAADRGPHFYVPLASFNNASFRKQLDRLIFTTHMKCGQWLLSVLLKFR